MALCKSHVSSAAIARLLNRSAVLSNVDISDVLADYFADSDSSSDCDDNVQASEELTGVCLLYFFSM